MFSSSALTVSLPCLEATTQLSGRPPALYDKDLGSNLPSLSQSKAVEVQLQPALMFQVKGLNGIAQTNVVQVCFRPILMGIYLIFQF